MDYWYLINNLAFQYNWFHKANLRTPVCFYLRGFFITLVKILTMFKRIPIKKTEYIPYLLKFTGHGWWYVRNKNKRNRIRTATNNSKRVQRSISKFGLSINQYFDLCE